MLYCTSLLDCLPSLLILAVMTWSYYAYVIELCVTIIQPEDVMKETIYLLVYNLLFCLFMWTFFKVMCTDIAIVPNEFKVPAGLYEMIKMADSDDEKNDLLLQFIERRRLRVITRNEDGYIRFCNKCKHVKPDRAHHCSTCGTCILKMDHHCPWVNNCVGFSNYKYFVVFLLNASLYCTFYFGTTLEYFVRFWREPFSSYGELHMIVGFLVAFCAGVIVASFFCYHISMVSKNETTLEIMRSPIFYNNMELTFDVGIYENFTEVFGESWCSWFLPVYTTSGDGVTFPVRLIS